jgi:hypothetical protein
MSRFRPPIAITYLEAMFREESATAETTRERTLVKPASGKKIDSKSPSAVEIVECL